MNNYWFGQDYTDWDLLCNNLKDDGGVNKRRDLLLLERRSPILK